MLAKLKGMGQKIFATDKVSQIWKYNVIFCGQSFSKDLQNWNK